MFQNSPKSVPGTLGSSAVVAHAFEPSPTSSAMHLALVMLILGFGHEVQDGKTVKGWCPSLGSGAPEQFSQ